jgi:two-component system, chemotaxis family, chemotaxis protein CheY
MKKILIADDAKLMRDIIRHVLHEAGDFEILIARNGDEAVEMYKQHLPDVVTMDITMEGKNGLDAIREIIACDRNARMIVVTSLGQEKLLNACLASGARDYIIKPFSKERIRAAIYNALNEDRDVPAEHNAASLPSS